MTQMDSSALARPPERWRLAGWPGARPRRLGYRECHALAGWAEEMLIRR